MHKRFKDVDFPFYNDLFPFHTSGNLVLPKGAGVTFGSGEGGESYIMEDAVPGDIAFGFTDAVPPARTEWKGIKRGVLFDVTVKGEKVQARHWGSGVVLLERDRLRIKER